MDIFDFPDDYKPQKYLTDEEMEDITNYLKNHPLFMKQLPQNIEDNEHLVALQQLKEDMDTNLDAENLCTQGSETLRKNPNNMHYLKLAFQKYTQGINLNPTQPALLAKLHCNRALINLKNKNYGKVIIDCKICLKHDPQYTKAYYRCAQAYIAVGRFKQALQLLQKRQQKELQQLRKEARKGIEKEQKLKEEKNQIKQKTTTSISEYCQSKKYMLIPRQQPLPENAKIELIDNKLSIPILFAYPEFNQMDLIAHSTQQQKIKTYVGQLFESPLPWDANHEYNKDSCELFCQLTETKVMRVPKQARIEEIAKRVPMRGALEVVVLAKDNVFYKIYLKDKEVL